MRKLKFKCMMKLRFSSPVSGHYFALRCVPEDSKRQKVTITKCHVEPADYISRLRDGFGNLKLSGSALKPHDTFGYWIEGRADVKGMIVEEEFLHPIYKFPSRYTEYDHEVVEFAKCAAKACRDQKAQTVIEKAVCVMGYLYRHFQYVPGVTQISTTAGEALKLGKGVCQDYAHIMIAVMRYMGIPARYVTGMMIGEGSTHAWVEIYMGHRWYGLDPTNNLHIDDYYIKLAHGRDYGDCVIDKGRFLGNASQKQEIYVNVEEAANDGNSSFNGTSGG